MKIILVQICKLSVSISLKRYALRSILFRNILAIKANKRRINSIGQYRTYKLYYKYKHYFYGLWSIAFELNFYLGVTTHNVVLHPYRIDLL